MHDLGNSGLQRTERERKSEGRTGEVFLEQEEQEEQEEEQEEEEKRERQGTRRQEKEKESRRRREEREWMCVEEKRDRDLRRCGAKTVKGREQ